MASVEVPRGRSLTRKSDHEHYPSSSLLKNPLAPEGA